MELKYLIFVYFLVLIFGKSAANFAYASYHADLQQSLQAFENCFVHISQPDLNDQVRIRNLLLYAYPKVCECIVF